MALTNPTRRTFREHASKKAVDYFLDVGSLDEAPVL